MERAPGPSVRVKLMLSYVGFLMVAGVLMLAAVWVVVLRYIPPGVIARLHPSWWIFADRSDPLNGFGAAAALVLALLLVFGLVGGWLLAGRMLAPLTRITDATRVAATGALSHRIRLPGRNDELRELADSFDAMLATTRSARRRTAEVRGQRLARAAHPAGDHADAARRRPQRSEPRHRRARRPPPRRQHPGDRSHRSAARAQPRRPAVLHPSTRRPVPHRGGSHRNAPPPGRGARRHHRDLG